jgi:hypothetical protein
LVKAPRTVETPRCFTENCADEWLGSIFQVPTGEVPACAAALAIIASTVIRIKTIRDMMEFFSEV